MKRALSILTTVFALGALTACNPLDPPPLTPVPVVNPSKPHSTPASGKTHGTRTPCETCVTVDKTP